jgi:dihydrofolate reductase
MRKIIVMNLVTVDGFFAGPKGEIDWHNVDDEFNDYAIEMLNRAGLLLFGRVTYELMAGYWPSPEAPKENPKAIADSMNNLPKIVFSRTMKKADWNNTRLVKEINPEEIIKMKQEPGKDIMLLGSGTIVQALTNLGLIDEFRLMVNPIILGSGKPMFKGVNKRELKLVKTKIFNSGNVLLCYQPK